jgi:hypothetical protein
MLAFSRSVKLTNNMYVLAVGNWLPLAGQDMLAFSRPTELTK